MINIIAQGLMVVLLLAIADRADYVARALHSQTGYERSATILFQDSRTWRSR